MLRQSARIAWLITSALVGSLCLPAHSAPPVIPSTAVGEFDWIESEYETILKRPIETWKLQGVRERFAKLLDKVQDEKGRNAIQTRIERIDHQQTLADSAATLDEILKRSRRRDHEVEIARQNLTALHSPSRKPFTATGLLQASSRQVDGHRVYALIGDEGRPVAYLDVPAGLDARPILSKRVGVRGSVRYNDRLGTRLIAVHDFETLQ